MIPESGEYYVIMVIKTHNLVVKIRGIFLLRDLCTKVSLHILLYV